MERMNLVASILFVFSDILAVASLIMPEWIISEIRSSVSGPQKFGLLRFCVQIAGRQYPECYFARAENTWILSFMCIFNGCIYSFAASVILFLSSTRRWHPRQSVALSARWLGLSSLILFCIAAILLPAGFGRVEIGGAAYQLPRNCRIGVGYILFILSLWMLIVSELFAGRFCTPRLRV